MGQKCCKKKNEMFIWTNIEFSNEIPFHLKAYIEEYFIKPLLKCEKNDSKILLTSVQYGIYRYIKNSNADHKERVELEKKYEKLILVLNENERTKILKSAMNEIVNFYIEEINRIRWLSNRSLMIVNEYVFKGKIKDEKDNKEKEMTLVTTTG